MFYSFARVSAVLKLKVDDYYHNGARRRLRLHEKGGKEHENARASPARADIGRVHCLRRPPERAACTVGSGIGAAHALGFHEIAGAFAGLAIALNGLLTALVVPLLVNFWPR
jgi:hypothetical protein